MSKEDKIIKDLKERNDKLFEQYRQRDFRVIHLEYERDNAMKIIEKAQKYNEHLIRDAKYHLNLGHLKKMDKILKGENDDKDKSNCE